MAKPDESRFYDRMLKGNTYKNLVKVLLEKSGYSVYCFGFESTFSDVKSRLAKNPTDSRTVRRIRSSPDLLVYDEQANDLMLLEVKMRSYLPPKIKRKVIENYKEFWNDSILAIVVPEGNVFYAQKISELETRPYYYRIEDFERFQDVFKRVQAEDISHYRGIALDNMKLQKTSSLNESKEWKPRRRFWRRRY